MKNSFLPYRCERSLPTMPMPIITMNITPLLRNPTRVIPILLLALAGFWAAPRALGQANANPPERMSYQGFLADGNGDPLGNTNTGPKNYDVIFRIMGDQSAGPTNWTEQQTVTVDRGNFSVLLGEGTPVGTEPHPALSSLFATNTASDRFVEMTVKGIGAGGDNVTILPRLRLITSPYAFLSKSAVNAANLVNPSGTALVTSSGGNVIISGPVSATSFSGIGTDLTAINASLISTGTLANARLNQSPTVTGTMTAAAFSGSGTALTALNGTNINNSTIELGKLVAAVQQALCPVGTILPFGGDNAPAGWLLCNGASYANSTYPNLVAVIGTRFGSGSGVFNVPDLRGRFLRGRDGGVGRDPGGRTVMNTGGATGDAVGSIQGDALQNVTGDIGEFDTYAAIHGTSTGPFTRAAAGTQTGIGSGSGDGYVKVTMNFASAAGVRTSSETRPANANVNYIIKY
jgi:microcystin-dependent protein